MDPTAPERQNREATLKALSRAVCVYWEHETARPIPDHLLQLAAQADEALAKRVGAPMSLALLEDVD